MSDIGSFNKILIIDDDDDLSMVIRDMLEVSGFSVSRAAGGTEAFALLSENTYHIILLDINLPDTTGLEICTELRKYSSVPIIFASARNGEDDRIKGYDTGGDDYLPKPYSMKELIAHIKALIRRIYSYSAIGKNVSFGTITVDTAARTVTKGGKHIALSLKEFDLLSYLCKNKNTAIPKEKLISEVWGAFSTVEPSTLTVHIRWLREKLEDDPAKPKYIKTVYRVGYILEVPDEA